MNKSFVEKALRLDPSEKLALIDALYNSLDKPDPEIERAWINEAVARREAYLRGEGKLISMDEVFEKFK